MTQQKWKEGDIKIIKFCLRNFKHLGSGKKEITFIQSIYLEVISKNNLIASLLPYHFLKVKKKFPSLGETSDRGRVKNRKVLSGI